MFERRPDATLCTEVPPYRRMMPYIMRTRTESAVYFAQDVDLTRIEPFLAAYNAAHTDARASLFHVVQWALIRTLQERPRLNRFVAGGRLWQRSNIEISFAAKKEFDDDHPITTVKHRFDPAQSFEDMVESIRADTTVGRSDEPSHTDKELDLLLRLPGPLLRVGVKLVRGADGLGLLPASFIDSDPMFCSVFIANLGSLKMDSGYHHLYEYGNCPVFCVIGRTREAPVVVDGEVTSRQVATLKWSYDERVDDGMYAQRSIEFFRRLLEDPAAAGAWAPPAESRPDLSVVPAG